MGAKIEDLPSWPPPLTRTVSINEIQLIRDAVGVQAKGLVDDSRGPFQGLYDLKSQRLEHNVYQRYSRSECAEAEEVFVVAVDVDDLYNCEAKFIALLHADFITFC